MFRTVLVKKASKLRYMLGYLCIYDGDEEQRIFIKEISTLIIESSNVLITMPLLNELIRNNISTIICDEKHQPSGYLIGINTNYATSGNLFDQINFDKERIEKLWQHIVINKINNQNEVLKIIYCNYNNLLSEYLLNVLPFDKTNREGLAAKVYFNELFENKFNRNEVSHVNSLLDYGYAIILSAVNREIVQQGYNLQLGIWHKGRNNPYNLGCDFMEAFRPIIDYIVYKIRTSKNPLLHIRKSLTYQIKINNQLRYIEDAIGECLTGYFRFLSNQTDDLPVVNINNIGGFIFEESNETDNNV